MEQESAERAGAGWFMLVLRDVQFWVPIVVLAAGLFVLRWIA